jgi:hypothetical protein
MELIMESKRQFFFLFILVIFVPLSLKAKSSKYFKLGINCSSFRTAREKSEPGQTSGTSRKSSFGIKGGASLSSFRNEESKIGEGFVLGLWKEWRLAERIALAGEILFVRRSTILENKSVLPEYPLWQFPPYNDSVYYYNIDCSFDLFDLLLLLRQAVPLDHGLELQLIGGPGLSLGIKDRSRLEYLYSVPVPDDRGVPPRYDYAHSDNDKGVILTASGFNFNLGMGLKKSFVSIEFRYTIDLHETEKARRVRINKKYQTVNFLLSFSI